MVELLRSTVIGLDTGIRIGVPDDVAAGLVDMGEIGLGADVIECDSSLSSSSSSSFCSSSVSKVVTLLNREDKEL